MFDQAILARDAATRTAAAQKLRELDEIRTI
jgi:hypothetical protein